MKFKEKLSKESAESIWQEHCSFLDLTMAEYMQMQKRLLMEQISLLSSCNLGKRLLKGSTPQTVKEFRETVPLTDYEDYADTLLMRREEELPSKPHIWLETTWEGGEYPSKTAPYSKAMLETYTHNLFCVMILAASSGKGIFRIRSRSKVLYTLAPLPYASGLFPELMKNEVDFNFMPPVKEALEMGFSQQMARGFELAIKHGMNQFFGMSSILYFISQNLLSGSASGFSLKMLSGMSPVMLYRLIKARYRSKRDNVPILPRDIFKLDAFVCVGNDSTLYKPELEKYWGKKPMEIAGGTEPTLIGTETWSRDGMVFFPDACFYEFIPEKEMRRSLDDPDYTPRTYLMDELNANQLYELVITVLKGGIFVRYRVGDVYRCLRLSNSNDKLSIPQFEFVDRTPNIIDIGAFTRITAKEIEKVIRLSRLPIKKWTALKEYDSDKQSFLQMFLEVEEDSIEDKSAAADVLKEHLSLYFRYFDSDYVSLKKMLKIDPLRVTLVKNGSFQAFETLRGYPLGRINPPAADVIDFRSLCAFPGKGGMSTWQ